MCVFHVCVQHVLCRSVCERSTYINSFLVYKEKISCKNIVTQKSEMDVFNKVLSQITTSVHSSVQIANTILPGNPLIREYDQIEHISSGGIGCLLID